MVVVRVKLKAGYNTPSHMVKMMHKYQGTIHIFKYWYWKHKFKQWLRLTARDTWYTIHREVKEYERDK